MTVIVLGYCDAPGSQGMTLHARGNDCVNWSPQHITQVDDHVQDMTLKEYWTKGPGSTPLSLNHRTKEKNVEHCVDDQRQTAWIGEVVRDFLGSALQPIVVEALITALVARADEER